jgi:hypothetical protein
MCLGIVFAKLDFDSLLGFAGPKGHVGEVEEETSSVSPVALRFSAKTLFQSVRNLSQYHSFETNEGACASF